MILYICVICWLMTVFAILIADHVTTVRICLDQESDNEDIAIELVELYVQ